MNRATCLHEIVRSGQGPRLVAIGLVLAIAWGCQETAGGDNLVNLGVITYYNGGNCLYSRKEGAELGRLRCSRASRTVCRLEALPELAGNLIVRAETQDRFRAEWLRLAEDRKSCEKAVAAAMSLKGYQATDDEHNREAPQSNHLELIDDCGALESEDLAKLAQAGPRAFLTSARGILAWQAELLGEQECLDALALSLEDREAVRARAKGELLLETECYYGSGVLFFHKSCSDKEKDRAYRFDFQDRL